MIALISILTACTRSTEPVEPAAPPADPPPAVPEKPATPISEPVASSPGGAWSSTSCGERTYERRITFRDGGAFSGEERISPCPPDVACVWSGIHTFSGDWALVEESITLTVTKTDAQDAMAASWPSTLTWSGGRLLEGECVYGPMKLDDGPR